MTNREPTFEEAELELQTIIEKLESGHVAVDEAIALWERGEALYAICRQRLDAVEGKIEELAERVQSTKPSA
jgi:exodeoxyribonuclease VII small subunit